MVHTVHLGMFSLVAVYFARLTMSLCHQSPDG